MTKYTTYLPAILMAHKAWFKRKRSSHVQCKRKGSKKRKRSSSPLSKMVDENQPLCFFTLCLRLRLRLRFPGSQVWNANASKWENFPFLASALAFAIAFASYV